jgi:uncharacterized protein
MVRLLQDTWLVTVNDAWRYSQCPQAFINSVDVARGVATAPPPPEQLLQRLMGEVLDQHRARLVRDLTHRSANIVTIDSPSGRTIGPDQILDAWQSAHHRTHEALRDRPDAIIRPVFLERDYSPTTVSVAWAGGVDIATRSPRFAPDVDQTEPGWELWEAKLGASQTGKTLMRLAAFTEHCERWGFDTTNRVRIVFANGPDSLRGIQTGVDQWVEVKQRLVTDLDKHLTADRVLTWPDESYPACGRKTCAWCSQVQRHHDDIFQLPGITQAQRTLLRQAGFVTVSGFAETSRREVASRLPLLRDDRIEKLHTQATLMTLAGKTDEVRPPFQVVNPAALTSLPPASSGDLFVDFEADPTFRQWSAGDPYFPTGNARHPRWWLGLDYLLGLASWETTEQGENFTVLWAENFEEEEKAFDTFLALIAHRRDGDPNAHVYHYAPYEMVALHRMARRYRHGSDMLSRWEKQGVFVDLHRVFTRAIIAGIPNYSLKSVEKLFIDPDSRTAITGGEQSVESVHDFWLHQRQGDSRKAAEIKEEIVSYNRQDTLSTRELATWLRQHQEEN